MKDIYDCFISLLPNILRTQHTALRVKCIHLTQFYPKPHQNQDTNLFKLNKLQFFGNFCNLTYLGGGLIEMGAYSIFWLRGERLIRKGGLKVNERRCSDII